MTKKWLSYADYDKALTQALESQPPVIVVEGEEDFLRAEALTLLRTTLEERHAGIALAEFYGPGAQGEGGFDLREVVQELNCSSLFAARKIVVFRRAQRALFSGGGGEGAAAKGGPLEGLAEYVKNPAPDNFLLLEVEKINRTRNIGKALAACLTVPAPVLGKQGEVVAWLVGRARVHGREIERDAADFLYSSHGGNLGALSGEVEKLALYTQGRKKITLEDARAFMTGTVEFSAFELTNAVEQRDLRKALYYAGLITGQGSRDQSGKRLDVESSAHQALGMLAARLENILRARAVVAARGSVQEVAGALGVGPWQAEGLYAAAKRFSIQQLMHALKALAQEMHAAHDTGSDPRLSLERAVIAACGN